MLEDLKLKTGEIVSTSLESGKVIDNFYCYIACVLKNQSLQDAKVEKGSDVRIRLSNAQEITAKIEYITQENDSESVVVFKIDKNIEELINYRKVSFDVLWWSENGLKVPNDAIKFEEDDLAYVVRKGVGYTDNVFVKILKQNDKYTIIQNYTYQELKALGFDENKLKNRRTISLYDEIEI